MIWEQDVCIASGRRFVQLAVIDKSAFMTTISIHIREMRRIYLVNTIGDSLIYVAPFARWPNRTNALTANQRQ